MFDERRVETGRNQTLFINRQSECATAQTACTNHQPPTTNHQHLQTTHHRKSKTRHQTPTTGGYDRSVRVWDMPGGKPISCMDIDGYALASCSRPRDANTVVVGTSHGSVYLIDLRASSSPGGPKPLTLNPKPLTIETVYPFCTLELKPRIPNPHHHIFYPG